MTAAAAPTTSDEAARRGERENPLDDVDGIWRRETPFKRRSTSTLSDGK